LTSVVKSSNGVVDSTEKIRYIYNERGLLVGFEHLSKVYYYVRDLLGSITEVVDENGSVMVSYTYDAWGKVLDKEYTLNTIGENIALLNHFVYKGYYLDSETDWIYFTSSFYDVEKSIYVGSKGISELIPSIEGTNLFSYAVNNPIMIKQTSIEVQKISLLNKENLYDYDLISTENLKKQRNLEFTIGLYTSESEDVPSWLSINAFYVKGSLGWGYSVGEGYSLASISVGVLDAKFSSPKLFSSLSSTNELNPNLWLGLGTWNANASIGVGISGIAEIVSVSTGVQFGDAVNIGVKGYVGAGFSADLSNGIKFGVGLGLGYEVSIEFDWWNIGN